MSRRPAVLRSSSASTRRRDSIPQTARRLQIYVQAKRYTDSKVSSGEIRDFFGSLDRFKASKGLFVTTSTFSPAAKESAEMLNKRIVLIDGPLLTRLMIRYNIGCRVEEVVHIKTLDEGFFD